MKRITFKTICVILIATIMLNFLSNPCFASDTDVYDDPTAQIEGTDSEAINEENNMMQELMGEASLGGKILDGIVGVLLYLPKLLGLGTGVVIQVITGGIVSSNGVSADTNLGKALFITPEIILFNRAAIVDINFFSDTFADGEAIKANSPILVIRENIARWFYGLRNFSIIVLLCILIYVGINMAISTIAEDKAKYRRMLVDWLVSFVLVFALQYIIIITISANNTLVNILYNSIDAAESTVLFGDITSALITKGLSIFATIGIGSTLVYLGVVIMTLMFLIMYVKRMITIAFLILISPIITITYSLDKIKDKSAQALNTWLSEFIYNILIQPFHCILYLVFVVTAIKLLNGTLAGMVLALFMMFFIFQAEDIIRKIFGLGKASSLGKLAGAMAGVYGGYKLLDKVGKQAGAKGGGTSTGGSKAPKLTQAKNPSGGTSNSSSPSGSRSSSGSNASASSSGSNASASSSSSSSSSGSRSSNGSSSSNASSRNTSGGSRNQKRKIANKVKSNVANGARWVGKTVKNVNMKAVKSGMPGALLGSMIGGMKEGGFTGMVAGATLGSKADKATQSILSGIKLSNQLKSQERRLASTYNNLQENGGFTAEQMTQKVDLLMNVDPDKIDKMKISDDEKAFANQMFNTMGTYAKAGYADPQVAMKETIKAIQNKKIKPKF